MSDRSSIKLAIVSDLHCKHSRSDETIASTLLYTDDIAGATSTNPYLALKELIKTNELRSDILICPGDITDKSDKQGLASGWQYLEKIRERLDADDLLATVGNHDVDITNVEKLGPLGVLKRFEDNYPVKINPIKVFYWDNDFCLYNEGDLLVFIFNSCYTHLNHQSSKLSSIDQIHLDSIAKELKKLNMKNFKFKIALCHHHPINHSNISNPDIDLIDKGELLVKLLEDFDFQVIIHGHKHDPRLSYRNSMPIFCAGSFSSTQNVNDLRIENTFHIIELLANERKGIIESWVFIPQKGWITKMDTHFPCLTGFGFRGNLETLAKECAAWLKSKGQDIVDFKGIKEVFPDINFLSPEDQITFNKKLLENDIEVTPNFPNIPKYFGFVFKR